jgi:hypothetical protein
VILFGFLIVFINDTPSASCLFYRRKELQVSLTKLVYELSSQDYSLFEVNGTHLAADSTSFLEKRRRGLVRFTNSLVQHPVLSQEQLVVMFLTVPTV